MRLGRSATVPGEKVDGLVLATHLLRGERVRAGEWASYQLPDARGPVHSCSSAIRQAGSADPDVSRPRLRQTNAIA